MRRFPTEPIARYLQTIANPANPSDLAEQGGTFRQMVDDLGALLGRTQFVHTVRAGRSISEEEADKIAVHLGFHPRQLWPEWDQRDPTEGTKPCANDRCGAMFTPRNALHAFCSTPCRLRAKARRQYHRAPARHRERTARWRANNYERKRLNDKKWNYRTGQSDRKRERYHTDAEYREKVKAERRAAYWRKKGQEAAS